MTASIHERLSRPGRECPALADYTLDDYKGDAPRWCVGCGDNSILTAVQRLCRDEQLAPHKTVFVSGIGCSSRLPHYMNAYGFHGIHGRALPVAEGIKMTRPDLNVFVATGDGDCCSIGTAHWIHGIRYNIDMTVLMLDNQIYGLTKKQVSPTTPRGLITNTTPHGAYLEPLNPLSVTLGVANVSFVAQAVDWIPELLYEIVSRAFHHKGCSFVRVLQRCPEFLPDLFEPILKNPDGMLLLAHEDGVQVSQGLSKIYRTREEHDPANLHRAREIASITDRIPVGVLYRNEAALRYDDIRKPNESSAPEVVKEVLESEFDKFTIGPPVRSQGPRG
jgi:2-oxoglutarate ferredoxin oxidoreductase subunit beta